MRISEEDQISTDFDWFCVDQSGHVGHFASAGFKSIPSSVARSGEDLKAVTDFLKRLPARPGAHQIEGYLGPDQKSERYLRSFIAMADRGLYSFDIGSYLSPDIHYFRVASPREPLKANELPRMIREILSRTVLRDTSLSRSTRVSYMETLEI